MDISGFGVRRPRTITRSFARLAAVALASSAITIGASGATLAPATAVQPVTAQPVVATVKTALAAPETYERRVHRLVNLRRANHGLRPLKFAGCADSSAESWASYLARNNEFFHQSMLDVLNRCDAQYAGETLGRGAMAPRKLVRMWMESPGHRAVLLSSKSTRLGIGAAPDAYGRWVVAANFIRP